MRSNPKILIIRLGALGDVVNTLPSLNLLRRKFPSAHIAWLVEDGSADILRGVPILDEIIVFPRNRWVKQALSPSKLGETVGEGVNFLREIRRKRFGAVLDYQANFKSGVFSALTGAPLRVGFSWRHARELNYLFNNRLVALPRRPIHRVQRAIELAKAVGASCKPSFPEVAGTEEDKEFARGFVGGLAGNGPLIGIHPGTSKFGEFKRWGAEKFAALARELNRQLKARVFVTWGPSEEALARQVAALSGGSCVAAPPTKRLRQLVELIRLCDLFIAGDTGPLHIAAALGVRVVGIYGPKDPKIYGPYSERALVVRVKLPCSPCRKRSCGNPRCMRLIRHQTVFEAAKALLNR